VLIIVPDATRTAPVGSFFRALHRQIAGSAAAFDVMVALGTHQPMSEDAICRRLEITPAERAADFANVRLLNHEWDNPAALRTVGTIPAADISALSGGLFAMEVEVKINARFFRTRSSAFPAETNTSSRASPARRF
jgi:nickel-dependent lactate racemase